MSWIYLISPIFAIIAVFIAYMGGYKAGKKKAELEQKTKEQKQSEYADKIISDNFGLDVNDVNAWLSNRSKK